MEPLKQREPDNNLEKWAARISAGKRSALLVNTLVYLGPLLLASGWSLYAAEHSRIAIALVVLGGVASAFALYKKLNTNVDLGRLNSTLSD